MGPEFRLQRAVWVRGHMQPDPEFSQGGDCDSPRPNDPRRPQVPAECRLGDPFCGPDYCPGEGDDTS